MFRISELTLGRGLLGIAPLPGRSGQYEADLTTLYKWDPAMVMTMTTTEELHRANVAELGSDLSTAGVHWAHLPVPDFGAPPPATQALWKQQAAHAHTALSNGGRVLAHCYGGCGRSGMALLRLMVEAGEAADTALVRLRKARACAVETDAQLAWAASGFGDG